MFCMTFCFLQSDYRFPRACRAVNYGCMLFDKKIQYRGLLPQQSVKTYLFDINLGRNGREHIEGRTKNLLD